VVDRYRILVLFLAAAALTGGAAAAAPARSASKPMLQLVQRSPLQVRGVRFMIRERVRVTASNGTRTVVRVARTTRRGTFNVDFGTIANNHCLTISITAVGARGDRARLVVGPKPGIIGPC
jgi:hypothetical protein